MFEIPESQRCSRCKIEKPLEAFHRQWSTVTGRHAWCKDCFNANARLKRNKKVTPEQRARWNRATKYGLTEQQYQEMVARQAGLCAICESEMEYPRIDHCHRSGRVRALLCQRCNLRLAGIEDPVFLQAALKYLALHQEESLSQSMSSSEASPARISLLPASGQG